MGSVFGGWAFVELAKTHDFKYDYSKFEYKNSGSVTVICKDHGEFQTTVIKHRHGAGCPKCKELTQRKKLDAEFSELVKKYNEKYNYKYNYVGSVYQSMGRKITIECPAHGEFQQTPKQHLEFSGCKQCSSKRNNKDDLQKENEEKDLIDAQKRVLIESFVAVYGIKYNYDLFVYKGVNKKIIIQCLDHGIYRSTPLDHIRGDYCPDCRRDKMK